ncbi:uncharacterized protein [Lepidochelys kempii]|uniref:uncharacterized protein isoform X1 n=1 Tax=Lepidochelys kempii TaxID=8472 RepID=UPI003C6F613C
MAEKARDLVTRGTVRGLMHDKRCWWQGLRTPIPVCSRSALSLFPPSHQGVREAPSMKLFTLILTLAILAGSQASLLSDEPTPRLEQKCICESCLLEMSSLSTLHPAEHRENNRLLRQRFSNCGPWSTSGPRAPLIRCLDPGEDAHVRVSKVLFLQTSTSRRNDNPKRYSALVCPSSPAAAPLKHEGKTLCLSVAALLPPVAR